jgi:hypothetical protein
VRKSDGRVNSRALLRLACLLVCATAATSAKAETSAPKIVCRASLAESRRAELASQLRAITGWPGLRFDGEGFLSFGAQAPSGGSRAARALLAELDRLAVDSN